MDGEQFDAIIRHALLGSSRREMVRRGVGALTLSAFGMFGLSSGHDVGAKGKGKKRRRKKPVCTCSTAGCTQLKVKKPSKVINANPRCNYAGACGANPCAATATTTTTTTTTTTGPGPIKQVNQACTPGVDQCVSNDANQPTLTCGLKNTEQQCNSTVAQIPGPTACCVPLGSPCFMNSCQCCGTDVPGQQTFCNNPGPVGTCATK